MGVVSIEPQWATLWPRVDCVQPPLFEYYSNRDDIGWTFTFVTWEMLLSNLGYS